MKSFIFQLEYDLLTPEEFAESKLYYNLLKINVAQKQNEGVYIHFYHDHYGYIDRMGIMWPCREKQDFQATLANDLPKIKDFLKKQNWAKEEFPGYFLGRRSVAQQELNEIIRYIDKDLQWDASLCVVYGGLTYEQISNINLPENKLIKLISEKKLKIP